MTFAKYPGLIQLPQSWTPQDPICRLKQQRLTKFHVFSIEHHCQLFRYARQMLALMAALQPRDRGPANCSLVRWALENKTALLLGCTSIVYTWSGSSSLWTYTDGWFCLITWPYFWRYAQKCRFRFRLRMKAAHSEGLEPVMLNASLRRSLLELSTKYIFQCACLRLHRIPQGPDFSLSRVKARMSNQLISLQLQATLLGLNIVCSACGVA